MKYKQILCASVLPVLVLASSACSRSGEEGTRERARETVPPATAVNKMASVRFIDADKVADELWFGDMKLFSDVEKNAVSKYKEAPAERHEFELMPAGSTPAAKPLAKNSEGLDAGKFYTVIAFNDSTKKEEPTLRVVNDDTSAPATGKAKVRIIHAAPGMEGIDVYASGRKDKLAGETRFTSSSNWQEVDPTDTSIEIRTTNDKEGIVRLPNFHLEADKLYTFVVMGGEKEGTKLRVVPIVDSASRRTRG